MKPSNEELVQLASVITQSHTQLSAEYAARLRRLASYAELADSTLLEVARDDVDLLATCLKAGDPTPFTDFLETRLSERVASGFEFATLQDALTAIEETILPLVSGPEGAKFVWRMMSRARTIVSRLAAERARAHERDQSQAALRESEEQLRLESAALAAAANAIVITDRQGRIVWVNPAFTALTGYTTQEVLDQNPRLLKSGHHDVAFYRNLWDTVLAGYVWQGEVINRRKDGSLYTEDQMITPVRNERGEITHFIAIKQDITERKQIEDALRQREQQYRQIIEESVDISFTCDPHGRFTFVSSSGKKVTGYAPEELVGRHFTEIIHAEWQEQVQAFYLKQFQERTEETLLEFPIVTKTGEEKWVEQSVKLSAGDKRVTGFQGIVRDITERKRLEQQLQESELKFREIVNRSLLGIFRTTLEGQIVEANPALLNIVRLDSVEQANQVGLLNMYADQADRQRLLAALREGPVSGFEMRFRRGDGEIITISVGAHLVYDEKGQPQFLEGTFEDITKRKQAEAALRDSEALYHSLVENLPQSIFVKDLQGQFTFANERFCAELGLSREELIGQTDYDIHPPDQAEKYRADDKRIIEGGQTVEVVEERQVLGWPRTYVRTIKTPTRDAAGQVNGLLGIFWDVTTQMRMEKAISESLERRTRQMELTTQVAQEIAAAPALEELVQRMVTLIKERFGYYHAQIFRYEPALNAVVLVAGYGEAGRKMLAAGHRLPLGRGVVGTATVTGKTVLATDVTQDKDWRPNPNLPDTRGELAVPIKLRDEILGILDVQSDRAGALTTEDQLLLEGLCGQIAIAIEDTRLSQEMQERLNEISTVYRAMSREGWQAFRETGRLPGGYLFEERTLKPKPDLWLPEIEQAVKQNATASSASSGSVVTPLSVRGGEVIGALGVMGDPTQRLSPDDMDLITSVSEQVSLALESARLFEQTQAARQQAESRVREMQILNTITQKVSSTLDLDSVLDVLINTLSTEMGFTYIAFNLIDDATRTVRTLRATGLARGNLGLARSIDQLQNDIIMDIARKGHIEVLDGWDDRFDRELWEREGHADLVRAFVPLRLREQTIAILEVGTKRKERPVITPEEIRLLGGLADQVSVAIQNTRLLEEAQQRNAELAAINEIITSAGQTLELKPILDAVLRRTMQIVNFDGGLITMQNEARGKLERIVRIGLPGDIPDDPAEGLENSLCAVVFSKRDMLVIQDFRQGAPVDVSGEIESGYYSYVGVPIEARGRPVGTLCGFRKTAGPFGENVLALLRTVSRQLGFAIENARLFEQAQARAHREQVLREVTARIRSSTDPDTVMRTLARELGTLLNRPAFVRLASSGSGQTGSNSPAREGGK